MADRQAFIERAIGRHVPALKALTQGEALMVIRKFAEHAQARRSTSKSLWDDREELTWIDRL